MRGSRSPSRRGRRCARLPATACEAGRARTSEPPSAEAAGSTFCEGVAAVGAVLAPLALYVLTMPHTVALEDDGLFLMAGASLGVAHPPGYPLYTLICHLVMQFPIGTPAFLGHLSSAVLGALACGAVYACARLLGTGRLPALAAAWLFGASEHVWAQAIIAEVYTLHALLFFAVYGLLRYGVRQPQCTWAWVAAAIAYGLSLANHWPLMVLATPGLVVAALPAWRALLRRWPLLLAGMVPSAALPYVWMVWRSHRNPFLNFYGPIDSFRELWFYVSRSGYSVVDTSPSAGWGDRLQFLQWLGNEMVWQLTLPGFVLALVGFGVLLQRRRIVEAGSGLLAFLGSSVALVALLGLDFDFLGVAVFRPYSVVCYGLIALWLAVGLQFLIEQASAGIAIGWPGSRRWLSPLALVVVAVMTLMSVRAHWQVNDRSRADAPQRYAETVFDLLPPDTVLLTHGDNDTSPLGYYVLVERRRPDVTLYNAQGLVFGNRLYEWRVSDERKRQQLRNFVNRTERPVFYLASPLMSGLGFGVRDHGFVREVVREGSAMELAPVRPEVARLFEDLLVDAPVDRWERYRRSKLIYNFATYLGHAVMSGDPLLLSRLQPLVALAEQDFYGLLAMAEVLLEHGGADHLDRIESWLQRARALEDETAGKERRARLRYLQGFLRYQRGARDEARSLFEESRAIYPHPENASLNALRQMGPSR